MADVTTRTLSNYLASLQATPSEDVTLVTQGLETWSTANLVTPGDLGTAAYQDVSYFALAASGVLANSAVQSVTGSGAVSVNNADPRNPIISIVGGGTGDVTGPASATAGRFASFNGTTGKLLQDSGFGSASFATAAQGTLAGTALQPAAIGTTVQGYSAVLAATTASFTTAKDTKLSGIATGATANNTDAFLLARANHTGTQSADTLTDGTTNKAFLATERTKLAGIATGATANNTDAYLLARANHTGTQAASTVTGLSTVATTGAYGDLSGKPTLGSLAAKNTVTAGVDFSATGTPSATTYLRGDNVWATPAGGGGGGGGQVNSVVAGAGITVDPTDPVNPIVLLSTASQTSLGKADTALQSAAIGVSVQGYDADLQSWGGVTRASGFDTFTATPSSANLAALLTDETGTGANVFATSPVLVTPNLGTPSAATLTNATGLPVATGISGLATGVATFLATPTSANLIAAVTNETGTGSLVFNTSPTLVTPALGTPASGTLTNATGLPLGTGTTGTLTVARGGTGVATLTGIVKAAGTANFAAAVAGTDYYAPGGTDVAVADGGTGVSTLTGLVKGNGTSAFTAAVAGTDYLAPAAIGTTVQAYDADLAAIAALAPADGTVITRSGGVWIAAAPGGNNVNVQTGVFNSTVNMTTGTFPENLYVDITISAVNTAKSFITVLGTSNAGSVNPSYLSQNPILFGRLVNSTTLRLYVSVSQTNPRLGANWQVVEFA